VKLIKPIPVTDARLDATNVPEDDYPEWASGTSYVTDDLVMVTDPGVHQIYKAATSTTGDYPPDNPTEWAPQGPTNRWAAFDRRVSTVTVSSEPYSAATYNTQTNPTSPSGVAYTITVSELFDGIALLNLSGIHVDVQVETPTLGVVYSKRIGLIAPPSQASWWHYFFGEIRTVERVALTDIPRVTDATIKVAIHGGPNPAEVGVLVIGQVVQLGQALYGLNVGIEDFSRKERDAFGRADVVERDFIDEMNVDILIPRPSIGFVKSTLASLRATPVVYIASDYDEVTIVYGFFRDFSIPIDSPDYSLAASLEIEGLT